jgi:hypothetical protein
MAISAYNTQFTTGAGDIVGEVTSISFSGISAAEIDVTNLASTAKSYVLGTMDGGTVEISCFMTAAAPTLPTSGDGAPTSYVLRFGSTGGPTVSFTGYVQNTSFEAAVDGAVTTTYTIRLTGTVTIAAGS